MPTKMQSDSETKKTYSKPVLREIELSAGEVLTGNCRTDETGGPYNLEGCQISGAPCSSIS